ncbi:MAG: hypothetical protein WC028_10800 [Candidatus Obscuribacterales bacterium]|jgi:hypothetical protein
MESINRELLLHDLERFGYPLVHKNETEPAEIISAMLQSKEGRVLEGVPVVLTHMLLKKSLPALEQVEDSLQNSMQRRFRMLAAITCMFLFWVPDSQAEQKMLRDYLKKREPGLLENIKARMESQESMNIGAGLSVDPERLENTFKNYVVSQFMNTQVSMTKKLDSEREKQFQAALSILFTEKQKQILFKVLEHSTLTKTEREYYSRVVKPRVKALKNADLQLIASSLLS